MELFRFVVAAAMLVGVCHRIAVETFEIDWNQVVPGGQSG